VPVARRTSPGRRAVPGIPAPLTGMVGGIMGAAVTSALLGVVRKATLDKFLETLRP
jgi:hypothetical protein